MPPANQRRVPATAAVDRDDDRSVTGASFEELTDYGRIEHRVIGRGEEPEVIRPRAVLLFQPEQPALHGRPHVRCLFRKQVNIGSGERRRECEIGHMGADHDNDVIHATRAQCGNDVFQDGPIAQA